MSFWSKKIITLTKLFNRKRRNKEYFWEKQIMLISELSQTKMNYNTFVTKILGNIREKLNIERITYLPCIYRKDLDAFQITGVSCPNKDFISLFSSSCNKKIVGHDIIIHNEESRVITNTILTYDGFRKVTAFQVCLCINQSQHILVFTTKEENTLFDNINDEPFAKLQAV